MSVKSATICKVSAVLSLLMAFSTATVFRACGPKDGGTRQRGSRRHRPGTEASGTGHGSGRLTSPGCPCII